MSDNQKNQSNIQASNQKSTEENAEASNSNNPASAFFSNQSLQSISSTDQKNLQYKMKDYQNRDSFQRTKSILSAILSRGIQTLLYQIQLAVLHSLVTPPLTINLQSQRRTLKISFKKM